MDKIVNVKITTVTSDTPKKAKPEIDLSANTIEGVLAMAFVTYLQCHNIQLSEYNQRKAIDLIQAQLEDYTKILQSYGLLK